MPVSTTSRIARQISLEDAIDLILLSNQLERKVIAENAVLVYPATPQKQRDYQDLVIRSFYLENADAKTTLNLLKTMLKTRDAFVDTGSVRGARRALGAERDGHAPARRLPA